MRLSLPPLLLTALLCGCPPGVKDDSAAGDADGDGWTVEEGDCDDQDPEVHPEATDWVGDGADADCDGVDGQDADGDGYASVLSGGGDCDDGNPYVFPGATEGWYDGVDQDCDGQSDYDQDGDGADSDAYGGGDCDDGDPRVHPDADEHCDGVDEDCDERIDEDPVDPETYTTDGDGDGWGGDGPTIEACEPPAGYAAEDGDCDDADALVHPEAPEHCDGVDEDCDGDLDEDAVDATDWMLDGDADGYGDQRTAVPSCEPIEGLVSLGGDCDDTDAEVNPGAVERCNDQDDDCDGTADEDDAVDVLTWYLDGDGDGFGDPAVSEPDCDPVPRYVADGTDCDDADADVYPGAYDRPEDGVDADCDGTDRAFDGVVLDYGARASGDLDAALGDLVSGYDVLVLFDTTGSMGSAVGYLDMATIAAGVSVALGDVQYGFATFDDYAYGAYGYSSSGDLPFILRQQVTDDLTAVETAVSSTPAHYGGDYEESSMEALYQALTGAGYDQGCDGAYDSSTDVLPFLADSADPFGGLGGEAYDATTSGGGTLGGVGFRDDAVPVIAYVTDAAMRDPSVGYGTPGGCPLDAGGPEVEAAALDLGAWLVGLAVSGSSTSPVTQMQALANATGSLADLDGDGDLEETVRSSLSVTAVNTAIAEAVNAIDVEVVAALTFDEVWLEASSDPYGMVASISPASYTGVTPSDWPLTFTVTWLGTLAPTSSPQTVIVEFDLYGDGDVIATLSVTVEVPPA